MTIGFSRWLRVLVGAAQQPAWRVTRPRATALDLRRLGARDLADLNLPEEVASCLRGQAAAEARRAWPR